MKKKKADSFTGFFLLLVLLAMFFLIRLLAGILDERKTYTALVSLGEIPYNEEFLNQAAKIEGIQEIWPVVEIPVTIKIEDYTESTCFLGIDLNAFSRDKAPEEFGSTPFLLLGNKSLQDMKDSNGHSISQKQQKKYLKAGENLPITYFVSEDNSVPQGDDITADNSSSFLPCTMGKLLENDSTQIYIPLSQAQSICQKAGLSMKVTQILVKVKGKANLERVKQLLSANSEL